MPAAAPLDFSPTNRHFQHRLYTDADPAAIWRIWSDVANWKDWDHGLRDTKFSGAFEQGAKGVVISLEGIRSKFELLEVLPGESYTLKSSLVGSSLFVKRYLGTHDGRTTFTHEVWFEGLTAGLFARLFGPKFRKLLPEVMARIDQQAQAR